MPLGQRLIFPPQNLQLPLLPTQHERRHAQQTLIRLHSERLLEILNLLEHIGLVFEAAGEFAAEIAVFVFGGFLGAGAVLFNKGRARLVFAVIAGRAGGRGRVPAVFPDVLRVGAAPFDVEDAAHCGGCGLMGSWLRAITA